MPLRSLVTASGAAGVLFALLGFSASIGHDLLPPLAPALVPVLHLALLALGFAAAWIGRLRGVEIDRERFAYADDPHATRDERLLAHREAEREHRRTLTALVAAPLALGYWLAYEFPPGLGWARALPVAALAGFGAGVVATRLRDR